MVATRSARFSRCVLRCQGSRSPSTALMLRAACSIPPIQTPNPSKNGPSSSRYPTVNHFRPKPIGGEDDNGVSVMRTACALGLAWTVLLAGVTAGAAQPAPERPLPPIRLPGIMYPDQPEAAPTSPERSSKARRSQPPAPLVTPASPPVQP